MKTHRSILFLSFTLGIISFIIVIFTCKDSKIFQIFLGLMGSSIVAGLLEIPNYISFREENENRIFSSLLNIKIQLIVIENTINKIIKTNGIITKSICDYPNQIINANMNTIYYFDRNYYLKKSKKNECKDALSSIDKAYNSFISLYSNYFIHYNEQLIEIIKKEDKERNIVANEMIDDLNELLDNSKLFYSLIDNEIKKILPKKIIKKWEEEEKRLQNYRNNMKW